MIQYLCEHFDTSNIKLAGVSSGAISAVVLLHFEELAAEAASAVEPGESGKVASAAVRRRAQELFQFVESSTDLRYLPIPGMLPAMVPDVISSFPDREELQEVAHRPNSIERKVIMLSHKSWLNVSAFVIGSFGPIAALASVEGYSEPARFTLDLLAWKFGSPDSLDFKSPTTRFLSALTGGFLVGWGMTIYLLQKHVYDLAPEGVRKAVVGGALSWFVLDSTGSIASGNRANALWNVGVLLAIVGPMWWPEQKQPPN
ncbi:unnamed protein product [Symbiodinium sp. KB8]|nr:unnamed protein product [Symbiodinium sp. KB8]